MAEYIERETIKYEQWSVGPLCAPLMVVRKKTIDSIPAADVAPVVHGRWSCDDEDGFENLDWHCDRCGGSIGYRCGNHLFSKYCPNCGARMDGDKK